MVDLIRQDMAQRGARIDSETERKGDFHTMLLWAGKPQLLETLIPKHSGEPDEVVPTLVPGQHVIGRADNEGGRGPQLLKERRHCRYRDAR